MGSLHNILQARGDPEQRHALLSMTYLKVSIRCMQGNPSKIDRLAPFADHQVFINALWLALKPSIDNISCCLAVSAFKAVIFPFHPGKKATCYEQLRHGICSLRGNFGLFVMEAKSCIFASKNSRSHCLQTSLALHVGNIL